MTAAGSDLPTFYSTAAQIIPVLFLATIVEAGVLWSFARPLMDDLDADGTAALQRFASSALLVLTMIVFVGEAQALYRLTGDTFVFHDDWPIYAALWAGGLAVVLPIVLAQVRLAAQAARAGRRPRGYLLTAVSFLAIYVAGAIADLVT